MLKHREINKCPDIAIVLIRESIEDAVFRALNLLHVEQDLVLDKVLLKPNLVRSEKPGSGIVTDYRVIRAIINYFSKNKTTEFFIGEGSGIIDLDTSKAYESSKMNTLDAKFIDFNNDRAEFLEPIGVEVAAVALDPTYYFINVPVIKAHHIARLSASLKNLMGCVRGQYKPQMHNGYSDTLTPQQFFSVESKFIENLLYLNKRIAPSLTVVDGSIAREIERDGLIVKLDTIIAGYNPVSVDSVCAYLTGHTLEQVPLLQRAEESGLGIADISKINVTGDNLADLKYTFKQRDIWRERDASRGK